MSEILEFGQLTLRRKREHALRGTTNKDADCSHHRVVLDDQGETVTCENCKLQLSAYWVLRRFVEMWSGEKTRVEQALRRVKEQTEDKIHLIAARRIERQWRSHTTIPACPHCHRGILPKDSLPSIAKRIELRRREVEQKK